MMSTGLIQIAKKNVSSLGFLNTLQPKYILIVLTINSLNNKIL